MMESWLPMAISIVMGCICAVLALPRGRSPLGWFLIGFILGWIGLILIFILPSLSLESKPEESPPIEAEVEQKPVQESSFEQTDGWFYLDQKKEVCGPFSFETIKEKWGAGDLSGNSWVWNETIAEWKKISQIKEMWEWLQETISPANPIES